MGFLFELLEIKGGTVRKKFYFENYRYSEDLDFTLLVDSTTNKQIFEWFKQTFEFVREEAKKIGKAEDAGQSWIDIKML